MSFEVALVLTGAAIAVSSTVVGAVVLEHVDRQRTSLESEINEIRRSRNERNAQVVNAASERQTAYLLLAVAQIPGDRPTSGPLTLMDTLDVAGTRMAQALLWLLGAVYWTDAAEEVPKYLAAEGIEPHIEFAGKGRVESIGILHLAYEKVFERWAEANNVLIARINTLGAELLQIETKLMRVKYVTAALQVTGILIALFNNIV